MTPSEPALKKTPLYELHRELGGKLVPFAGYQMPVQFADGIIAEHQHTRQAASLFDVSHMGQAVLETTGPDTCDRHAAISALLEQLVPGDVQGLRPGGMRYTVLLSESGGILDDLIVWRPTDDNDQGKLAMVVNGATKAEDFAFIDRRLAGRARLSVKSGHALLALQGPKSAAVMAEHAPDSAQLRFMEGRVMKIGRREALVTRSGYTGEDGFEISIAASHAVALARKLLNHPDVRPAGLGARDSLRLEAGLCLYGHDLGPDINPVEAGLAWTIGKRRRRDGGFPGAIPILKSIEAGPARRRVGLKPEGRIVAREGTDIFSEDGETIGRITSGTFGPTVGGPIAMGYVKSEFSERGDRVALRIRGRSHGARIVALPFVPHKYVKG